MLYSWPQLFVSTLWIIWKHRNGEVFQVQEFNPHRVWQNALTLTMDLQIKEGQWAMMGGPLNGCWVPPPGYLKLNVDRGFRDGKAVYGGVLRDDTGKWVWGFAGCFNGNSSLSAEIRAIKEGLQLLVNHGCLRVIVESDSSQLVNLFNSYPQWNTLKQTTFSNANACMHIFGVARLFLLPVVLICVLML